MCGGKRKQSSRPLRSTRPCKQFSLLLTLSFLLFFSCCVLLSSSVYLQAPPVHYQINKKKADSNWYFFLLYDMLLFWFLDGSPPCFPPSCIEREWWGLKYTVQGRKRRESSPVAKKKETKVQCSFFFFCSSCHRQSWGPSSIEHSQSPSCIRPTEGLRWTWTRRHVRTMKWPW